MDDPQNRNDLPPISGSWRFLRAYLTTFVVIGSYSWLKIKSRTKGPDYWQENVLELHRRNAKRIEDSILRLQGLFIKVGQMFSIMTNFLPEEFRSELENMQDAVPSRPYSQIEKRIIEELGGNPTEVFASFEKKPIAAASLGQVHVAETKDGRKVAVKVQHLGVEAMSHSDLKTIKRIIKIVKWFVKVRGIENFYQEIKSMILEELDFSHEAAYIEEIARNFEGNDKVIFPRVVGELSTSRVLTLEHVEGMKITNRKKMLECGLDPAVVAEDLVKVYCQMIFVDGVYHADPHPGNIMVQPDGTIVLLDFGAVGHLPPIMRQGISSFLEAIIKADETQLLRSLRTMGFLQVGANESEAASRVIEHFHRKFQEEIHFDDFSLSAVKIDTRKGLESLADLRQMNIGFRELSAAFHIPKEWVLLERTGLLLAGLCTHLNPEMNPADTIRPYLEEFVLGKDRDWSEMLFDLSRDKLLSFLAIPGHVEKVINRTLAGNVSFRVDGISAGVELLYAAGHQLIFTVLALASAGIGVYFNEIDAHRFARWAVYGTGGFVCLLVLSMFRARKHHSRLR